MSRTFTAKEIKQLVEDGAKQGVFYTKEEQEAFKTIKFDKAFICPEGEGAILITPTKEGKTL